MPFTFSHPGFILPIKNKKPAWFSTTGLVFGSIAPDMDIILRLTNNRFHIFEYDLKSILFFIVPIALLFSIYYHLILRNVIIAHLPDGFRERFIPYTTFNYLHYLKSGFHKVILSILAGIYLHLFLDWISHWNASIFEIYGGILYLNKTISRIYYYSAIYIPALTLTIAGIFMLFRYNGLQLKDITLFITRCLHDRRKRQFFGAWIFFACLIMAVKTYLSGIEKGFYADSLIIHFTSGILVSGILLPTFYFFRNKIKKVY